MDSSENQSPTNRNDQQRFTLSKHEIISGYNAYSRVLQNATTVSTNFLKAFIISQDKAVDTIDSTQSPLFTNNVKVGFIIAKKKIKKAVFRNRIRRLLKEAYRLNKHDFKTALDKIQIIFSLTEKGYDHFSRNPNEKLEFVKREMKCLSDKFQKKIK